MRDEDTRIIDLLFAIGGEYLLMSGHPVWGIILIVLAFL